jgi:hypothetical protein
MGIDLAIGNLRQLELVLATYIEHVGGAASLSGLLFNPCRRSRCRWLYLRFRHIFGLRCEDSDKIGKSLKTLKGPFSQSNTN